jgi:hypothetical protein
MSDSEEDVWRVDIPVYNEDNKIKKYRHVHVRTEEEYNTLNSNLMNALTNFFPRYDPDTRPTFIRGPDPPKGTHLKKRQRLDINDRVVQSRQPRVPPQLPPHLLHASTPSATSGHASTRPVASAGEYDGPDTGAELLELLANK